MSAPKKKAVKKKAVRRGALGGTMGQLGDCTWPLPETSITGEQLQFWMSENFSEDEWRIIALHLIESLDHDDAVSFTKELMAKYILDQ